MKGWDWQDLLLLKTLAEQIAKPGADGAPGPAGPAGANGAPGAPGANGSPAPLLPWSPWGKNTFHYGDSITAGTTVAAGRDWPNVLATLLNATPTNKAKSGAGALDMGSALTTTTPLGRSLQTILIGVNDQRQYLGDADKMAVWTDAMRAAIMWCAMPWGFKVLGQTTTGLYKPTYGGTWVNTIAWANVPAADGAGTDAGKNCVTNAAGQVVSCVVYGTVAYLCMLTQYAAGALTSTYDVTIDGVAVTGSPFFTKPQNNANITTVNGLAYGWRCHRFTGLADGAHTIVVTAHASAGNPVYFEWACGNKIRTGALPANTAPRVLIGSVPRQRADYPFGGSDVITAQYSAIIAQLVADAKADGFTLVEHITGTADVGLTHLQADGLHWDEDGEEACAQVYLPKVLAL